MYAKRFLLLALCIFSFIATLCQNISSDSMGDGIGISRIDSLINALSAQKDSSRISTLLSLTWQLRNSNPEQSVGFGLEAINLARTYNNYVGLAKGYGFVGVAYRVLGNYSKSTDFYFNGLDIALENNLEEEQGYAYLNIANLFIYQEFHTNSIENIKRATEIAERINNKGMLAYANLYHGRALQLVNELDLALEFLQKSLNIRKELNLRREQAVCLKYIGDIYLDKNLFPLAIENYNQALKLIDTNIEKNLYASILVEKSNIYLQENNLQLATSFAKQGLDIANQIGSNLFIRDASRVLVQIYLKQNDYLKASTLQQTILEINDKLNDQQLSEKIFLLEYQMERQQKQNQIEMLNRDNTIKELELVKTREEKHKQRVIIYSFAAGLVIIILFLLIISRLFFQIRVANKQLERKNQQIELQNSNLNTVNRKLVESENNLKMTVQTKDKLFSIIAHDLRNPFTVLIGLTDMLSKQVEMLNPNEIAEFSDQVHQSSSKLHNLIENLLHWSRSQIGSIKLNPKTFSLFKIVSDTIDVLGLQAKSKRIELRNEVAENLSVFADEDTISTVIRNLVSNAIKYSEPNGVVTLSAYLQYNRIVVKVSDIGIGIPSEKFSKLFNFEGSFSTRGSNQEAGTGLGLLVCKEFVEMNGGDISVESVVGEGTTFSFSLPV
jgi:signal transduction histidine kinase